MRKRSQRKSDELTASIMTVRMETAGKIQKSSKVGDKENCFNPNPPQDAKIEEYCNSNFTDSPTKFQSCKSPETFCYTCCDNEFGELHIKERDSCYKSQCEAKPEGGAAESAPCDKQ